MEALAEALAVAVHEEMSCWGALADTLNVSERISTVWKLRIVTHRILTTHVFFCKTWLDYQKRIVTLILMR